MRRMQKQKLHCHVLSQDKTAEKGNGVGEGSEGGRVSGYAVCPKLQKPTPGQSSAEQATRGRLALTPSMICAKH